MSIAKGRIRHCPSPDAAGMFRRVRMGKRKARPRRMSLRYCRHMSSDAFRPHTSCFRILGSRRPCICRYLGSVLFSPFRSIRRSTEYVWSLNIGGGMRLRCTCRRAKLCISSRRIRLDSSLLPAFHRRQCNNGRHFRTFPLAPCRRRMRRPPASRCTSCRLRTARPRSSA